MRECPCSQSPSSAIGCRLQPAMAGNNAIVVIHQNRRIETKGLNAARDGPPGRGDVCADFSDLRKQDQLANT